MSNTLLFAIDLETEEVVVSDSPKGSNTTNFIERVKRQDNEMLFYAVLTLTKLTQSANFDVKIFKASDKVCQMIYEQHKELL